MAKKVVRAELPKNTRLSQIAHLRTSLSVSPPAFSRHLCILLDRHKANGRPAAPNEIQFDRTKARDEIWRLLMDIRSRLRGTPKEGLDSATSPLLAAYHECYRQNRTFVLNCGIFLGLALRIAVNIYSEYCSVTIILDNAGCKFVPQESASGVGEVLNRLTEEIETLRTTPHGATLLPPEEYDVGDRLHSVLWHIFDRYFEIDFGQYGAIPVGASEDESEAPTGEVRPKEIPRSVSGMLFGDFQGFAVCGAAPATTGGQPAPKSVVLPIPPPIRAAPSHTDIVAYFNEHKRYFYSCMGMGEDGLIKNELYRHLRLEPNTILSYMLDGRAIYGSSLGNHVSARHLEVYPHPITNFVIYDGLSSDQLGRLLRRLHITDELRMAALLDKHDIDEVSVHIHSIGDTISEMIAAATGADGLKRSAINDVIHDYNELGKRCVGGLLYRVNRSAYYHEILNTMLPELREDRIEGWQSHRQFVHRNFDNVYSSIKSTGDRYRQVAARLNQLINIHQQEGAWDVALATFALTGTAVLVSLQTTLSKVPYLVPAAGVLFLLGGILWYRKRRPWRLWRRD